MMELNQLKAYLKSALDLEVAVLAAEQAIDAIDRKIKQLQQPTPSPDRQQYPAEPWWIHHISEPVKPTLEQTSILRKALLPSWKHLVFTFHLGALLFGVIYACLPISDSDSLSPAIIVPGVFAACIVCHLLLAVFFARKENAENQDFYSCNMAEYEKQLKLHQEAKADHEARMAAWRADCARMDSSYALLVSSRDIIEEQKQQACAELQRQRKAVVLSRDRLRTKLQKHYSNGPIYESYRNLVAVTQIYEYLASGIARELEGPDGAYAQYMNDVRAERICADLQLIREDMNQGFRRLEHNQQLLYSELQLANDQLYKMDNTLTTMSRAMDREIDMLQILSTNTFQWQQEFNASCQALNSSLEQIRTNTHTAALNTAMVGLNQYLDMKSRGADAYHASYYP